MHALFSINKACIALFIHAYKLVFFKIFLGIIGVTVNACHPFEIYMLKYFKTVAAYSFRYFCCCFITYIATEYIKV